VLVTGWKRSVAHWPLLPCCLHALLAARRVQNLSIRDNILFGLPFDEAKYKKVCPALNHSCWLCMQLPIRVAHAHARAHMHTHGHTLPLPHFPLLPPQVVHACALEFDLAVLQNGDSTLAGERGMNLSGGQRQRVGLARAAYHETQLVLLDNPLRWGLGCRNGCGGVAHAAYHKMRHVVIALHKLFLFYAPSTVCARVCVCVCVLRIDRKWDLMGEGRSAWTHCYCARAAAVMSHTNFHGLNVPLFVCGLPPRGPCTQTVGHSS